MIVYDDHAAFQILRRGIDRMWVEDALLNPDQVETNGLRQSYLKCLPGRRIMLRVVTPTADPTLVITAYFDRTKPCA